MTSNADFDRTWNYRFYSKDGLINEADFPQGLGGQLDSDEMAWRVADELKANGTPVVRMERESMAGTWEDIPVL